MIKYGHDKQGAFIAGDTETRQTSYAYPTSYNATLAKRVPERVANEMVAAANRLWENGHPDYPEYHARNWVRLDQMETV